MNEPSVCQLWLSLPANGSLATPSRNQSLAVTGDDGTVYFTGYIAVSPLPEYAGLGIEGPRYRIAIQAVSDELLLDQTADAVPAPARPARPPGALMTCAGDPYRLDGALDTGAFTEHGGEQLCSRSGRATGARARDKWPAWRGPRIARSTGR